MPNITDVAINKAGIEGKLVIEEFEGRFGTMWAIGDDTGTITIADTEEEAKEIVAKAAPVLIKAVGTKDKKAADDWVARAKAGEVMRIM